MLTYHSVNQRASRGCFENRVDAIIEEISVIRKSFGFEDADSPNIRKHLNSHSQPLIDTDLTELEQQRSYDEKEEIASEEDKRVSKEILIKELQQMFRNLERVKQQITDLDQNVERSMLVRRTLENGIICYRKLYERKRRLRLFKRRLTNIFRESTSSISIFHSFCFPFI
jgi:hypothetical protein